jgi:hypothetical protein
MGMSQAPSVWNVRPVFGKDWRSFVDEWCLGTEPALTEGEVAAALAALERHWPELLDQLGSGGNRGLMFLLPHLHLGQTILILQP